MVLKQPTLTPAQRRWIEEYLVDSNGRAAAMRAGCSSKAAQGVATRYSANTAVMAHVVACQEALRNPPAVSREDFILGLQEAFDVARQCGDLASMLATSHELAQVYGYGPADATGDKGSSQDVPDQNLNKRSDPELLKIITSGSSKQVLADLLHGGGKGTPGGSVAS